MDLDFIVTLHSPSPPKDESQQQTILVLLQSVLLLSYHQLLDNPYDQLTHMHQCHFTGIGEIIMSIPVPVQWTWSENPLRCRNQDISVWLGQYHVCWCPGPCITNVIATCRKNFSQWESSFLWKLRYHWLKLLRRVAKMLVIQGPGSLCHPDISTHAIDYVE